MGNHGNDGKNVKEFTNYDGDGFAFKRAVRYGRLSVNELLERPALLRLVGDGPLGRTLDVGCGYANLMDALPECCYVGVEIDPAVVEADAKARPNAEFHVFRAEDLGSDRARESLGLFDFAVSSMVFHHVRDLKAAFDGISLLLRPGAPFVFSILHPFRTATPLVPAAGHRRALEIDGRKRYLLSDYARVGDRTNGDGFVCHRPVSEIFGTLASAGFAVTAMDEPVPTREAVLVNPTLADEFDRPRLLLMRAVKAGDPVPWESRFPRQSIRDPEELSGLVSVSGTRDAGDRTSTLSLRSETLDFDF